MSITYQHGSYREKLFRTEEVNRIAPARQIVIQAEIDRLSFAIDSLDKVNMQLNEEIAQRPTIMTVQSVPPRFLLCRKMVA